MRFFVTVVTNRTHSLIGENEHFAGVEVADQFCSDGVERATFGRDVIRAVLGFAVTKRSEPVLVAGGDELLRGHHDERIRAFEPVHRAADGVLDRAGFKPLFGDEV